MPSALFDTTSDLIYLTQMTRTWYPSGGSFIQINENNTELGKRKTASRPAIMA